MTANGAINLNINDHTNGMALSASGPPSEPRIVGAANIEPDYSEAIARLTANGFTRQQAQVLVDVFGQGGRTIHVHTELMESPGLVEEITANMRKQLKRSAYMGNL